MINAGKYTRQAYYDALNGISVDVFKEDVPASHSGNFVVVRLESQTGTGNNDIFIYKPVVIIEVVAIGINSVTPEIADDIYSEVMTRLKPLPSSTLVLADGQHVSMRPGEPTYLTEDDGTKRYHRIISRWQNVIQSS